MKTTIKQCTCNGSSNKIVMACSGASDVGFLSDKVARSFQISGKRRMTCLAQVGANLEMVINDFKTKDLLVIDGCPITCGKKILDQHNFTNYKHLVITETGLVKGKTPANDENVNFVLSKALELE
jgi:uncharacterized metal-binding protein